MDTFTAGVVVALIVALLAFALAGMLILFSRGSEN